jgi:hypothetical protein
MDRRSPSSIWRSFSGVDMVRSGRRDEGMRGAMETRGVEVYPVF